MSQDNPPFEIHVHGDIRLRDDVDYTHIQEALRPLWKYVGARSLIDAAAVTAQFAAGSANQASAVTALNQALTRIEMLTPNATPTVTP